MHISEVRAGRHSTFWLEGPPLFFFCLEGLTVFFLWVLIISIFQYVLFWSYWNYPLLASFFQFTSQGSQARNTNIFIRFFEEIKLIVLRLKIWWLVS